MTDDTRTEARRRIAEQLAAHHVVVRKARISGQWLYDCSSCDSIPDRYVDEDIATRAAARHQADAILGLGQLTEEWRAEGGGWSFPAEGREDAEWQAAHRGAALRAVRVITLRLVVEPVVPEEPQP